MHQFKAVSTSIQYANNISNLYSSFVILDVDSHLYVSDRGYGNDTI